MKKPSTKFTEKQLTIISAATGAVVFLAICGVIFWAVSTAGNLEADVKKLEATKTDLQQKERDLPRLEKEIASLQVEVAYSVRKLPNEQEIADLIKNLGKIVKLTEQEGSTLRIRKFEPEQEVRLPAQPGAVQQVDQRFTPHPYIVEADGTFYQLGKFINLLESHIRFIKVESYEMACPKEEKLWDRPEKEIKMKIITYTYNPSQGEKVIPPDMPMEIDPASDKQFVFDARNRRDPFKIPLAIVSSDTHPVAPLSKEEQQTLVTKAERLYDELVKLIATRQIDAALKNFNEIESIQSKTQSFTVPQYCQRLQELYKNAKEQIRTIEDVQLKRAIARADNLLDEMNKAFSEGNYGEIQKLKDELDRSLPAQVNNPELATKIKNLSDKAAELLKRSAIRIEFFKADIRITGISRMPVRSTVIFNGNVHGEAGMDVTIGGVKFRVKAIDPAKDKVTVFYKGEEIVLTLGEERHVSAQAGASGKSAGAEAGSAPSTPAKAEEAPPAENPKAPPESKSEGAPAGPESSTV